MNYDFDDYTDQTYIHNGVKVYFKNGKSYGFDPVEQSDIWIKQGIYFINNGCYVYEFDKFEVDKIILYELYKTEENGYVYKFGEKIIIEKETK